jgi:cell division protein FtsL
MTPRHVHEKGKHRKKPKRDETAPEMEPIRKEVRKLGYEVEILAVIVAVAIIGIAYVLLAGNLQQTVQEDETVQEELDECRKLNPEYTEEDCNDLALKNRAILEDMPELCDLIKSNSLKNHCKEYFE